MTELLYLFARWVIPPCIVVGLTIGLASPLIRELKDAAPPGALTAHPPKDMGREIERLLDGPAN